MSDYNGLKEWLEDAKENAKKLESIDHHACFIVMHTLLLYENYLNALIDLEKNAGLTLHDALVIGATRKYIVCCKDCIYGKHMHQDQIDCYYDDLPTPHEPEFFCGYGERREQQ